MPKPTKNQLLDIREQLLDAVAAIDAALEVSAAPRKARKPKDYAEVEAYCRERRNGVDARRLFDHYTATGWCLKSGQPIKDWRACVRTWEQQAKKFTRDPRETPFKGAVDADSMQKAMRRAGLGDGPPGLTPSETAAWAARKLKQDEPEQQDWWDG